MSAELSPQQRATGFALALGLACLTWLALRSEAPAPEPRLAQAPSAPRAPARRAEVPEPPAAQPASSGDTEQAEHAGHEHAHEHAHAPAPAPSAAPELAPEPQIAAPPQTPDSWIVPLELGWDGAQAEQPIRSEVDFRPLRPRLHDLLFQARFSDASGALFSTTLPVAGLIPFEVAESGQELHAVGDQLFVSRAPVLLRLPDLELPIHVELSRPDGQPVANLLVHEVSGEVKVAVQ